MFAIVELQKHYHLGLTLQRWKRLRTDQDQISQGKLAEMLQNAGNLTKQMLAGGGEKSLATKVFDRFLF